MGPKIYFTQPIFIFYIRIFHFKIKWTAKLRSAKKWSKSYKIYTLCTPEDYSEPK